MEPCELCNSNWTTGLLWCLLRLIVVLDCAGSVRVWQHLWVCTRPPSCSNSSPGRSIPTQQGSQKAETQEDWMPLEQRIYYRLLINLRAFLQWRPTTVYITGCSKRVFYSQIITQLSISILQYGKSTVCLTVLINYIGTHALIWLDLQHWLQVHLGFALLQRWK